LSRPCLAALCAVAFLFLSGFRAPPETAYGGPGTVAPDAVLETIQKERVTITNMVPTMLKAQRLIERGQRVTVLAGGNGLEVRMPAEALSHGAKGERIRVRNLSSHRIIEGVVAGAGLVRVNP